jgi:tripartite-type tricarboxylate transporter receptor subunit TctC
MDRRLFLTTLTAAGAAGAAGALPASAQAPWPQRPVTIVSPWAAGGSTSTIARIVGDEMAKHLGQPVIHENKPGAGGALGSEIVAKAKPDGYTLLIAGAGTFYRNALDKDVPYDPEKGFSFVGSVGDGPFMLVTRKDLPAATLAELLEHGRKSANGLTFASAGAGSTSHLTGEYFKTVAGLNLTHVAYRGAAPAMTDLLAGRVDMLFDAFPTTIENVRGGRIRAIGVTTAARHALAPDIATLAEAGLPQFVLAPWWGLIAPAGVPGDALARLNDALAKALASSEAAAALAQQGVRPFATTPQAFEAYAREQDARWRGIIKSAGLSPA